MAKTLIHILKKHFLIVFFLSFYFIITSYKFIHTPTPFYDWDESIYAQVGREMIRQKSLVPLWQGQNWLDKPPLAPLTYGIVATLTPLSPEISTRVFTLILSIIILAFTYVFYYRLTKNKIIPLLTVVITAFTPIFLQRTQVLNVDVFLFLGWIGYLVFYDKFWLSLLFLAIGVLSKSLLGFYPVAGLLAIDIIQLYLNKIDIKKFKKRLIFALTQVGILSLWFLAMIVIFKFAFIKNQFLEAMFKRVTNSIESHFGQRTYYINLLFSELSLFAYLSIIGLAMIIRNHWLNKNWCKFALLLFFVPWFLFLNLTKTKIAWYLYPVIPQFAFLGVYFLLYLKKHKLITTLTTIVVMVVIFNQAFRQNNFFNTFYSTYDQYYQLAIYAGKNCKEIELLVDPNTRQTYQTLNGMNLTISTTTWWGNHPAIVYYSDKKVNFIYDAASFNNSLSSFDRNQCVVVSSQDVDLVTLKKEFVLRNNFKEMYLFTKAL